jgi:hypothetical protein
MQNINSLQQLSYLNLENIGSSSIACEKHKTITKTIADNEKYPNIVPTVAVVLMTDFMNKELI